MSHRKLSLKREELQELTSNELTGVVGAGTTWFSCMTYISCNPVACLPTFDGCIE